MKWINIFTIFSWLFALISSESTYTQMKIAQEYTDEDDALCYTIPSYAGEEETNIRNYHKNVSSHSFFCPFLSFVISIHTFNFLSLNSKSLIKDFFFYYFVGSGMGFTLSRLDSRDFSRVYGLKVISFHFIVSSCFMRLMKNNTLL